MKDEGNESARSGLGVGAAVQQQNAGGSRARGVGAGGDSTSGHRLAGAPGAAESSAAPVALTDGERRAYRMGVLAAGGIFADAACAKCKPRVENLRIAIAGRSVECEAPEFWPARGGR
jgi:hypothetical protein